MADAGSQATPPVIGIVTVLYRSEGVVEGFFDSLALQTDVAFKLYVIDNSPEPSTLDRCRELAARHGVAAEFLFNNANVGVAKGNNQGIAMARRDGCRYILLANNDTEFAVGTLASLLRPLLAGDQVSTPKILCYGPEKQVWFAGGRIDSWTMRTPHIGSGEIDKGQFDLAKYTGYAPTCFLMVDASVFERIGDMDERYFVYYDDTDFGWRLRVADIPVKYTPDAVVLHKVSTSTGGERSPFTLYYSNRNRIYFIRKNFKGLHKAAALTYVLVTRVVQSMRMSKAESERLWTGVRDGFHLPTRTHAG